jgi:hypothetical protein
MKHEKAVYEFLERIKTDNPQLYADFMAEEKYVKECHFYEIPYNHKTLQYIIAKKEYDGIKESFILKGVTTKKPVNMTSLQEKVFEMKYMDNKTVAEIADDMGKNKVDIYKVLERIKGKL